MKKAKPNATVILSNMVAGSLYGLAAINVHDANLSQQACETLAILAVGLLLQFVAVLNRKKLELLLISSCFVTTFAGGMVTKYLTTSYPILGYAAGLAVALILCDFIIKKFT